MTKQWSRVTELHMTAVASIPISPADRIAPEPAHDPMPLRGRRIAFFTSVEVMGGSEVLVADAIEAACAAGADVICFSPRDAAIRRILAQRELDVRHRDWPVIGNGSCDACVAHAPSNTSQDAGVASTWRSLAPVWLTRSLGFFKEASGFAKQLDRVRPDVLFVNVNGHEA